MRIGEKKSLFTKGILLVLFIFLCVGLVGCKKEESEEFLPTEDETAETYPPEEEHEEFYLTEEETALYDEYVKNRDISIFEEVSPVSIAKVFIQCGINADWECEYEMYVPGTIPYTKDEFAEMNKVDLETVEQDISRKSYADAYLYLLKDGEFTDVDGTSGYITFLTLQGDELLPIKFNMQKNKDGIWQINFDVFSD